MRHETSLGKTFLYGVAVKKYFFIIIFLFLILLVCSLPYLLFGEMSETRIGLRWGVIEETTVTYFKPFPMIQLMGNTNRIDIPYLKSTETNGIAEIEPYWYYSYNYLDKGGHRIDTDNARKLLMDAIVVRVMAGDESIRQLFIKTCAESVPLNPSRILSELSKIRAVGSGAQ